MSFEPSISPSSKKKQGHQDLHWQELFLGTSCLANMCDHLQDFLRSFRGSLPGHTPVSLLNFIPVLRFLEDVLATAGWKQGALGCQGVSLVSGCGRP